MKRAILLLICLSNGLFASAQNFNAQDSVAYNKRDSLLFNYLDVYVDQLREPQYELYPTENNWTFLKLNTLTGQIWQVQYSVDSSPRMEYVLDTDYRISIYDTRICGRFKLYPTKNMYNFILLDTIDGRCWQVQWSIEEKKRGVLRIY